MLSINNKSYLIFVKRLVIYFRRETEVFIHVLLNHFNAIS